MTTEYELQRQKNIAANLAILASLGLEKPAAAISRPKPKPTSNAKTDKTEESNNHKDNNKRKTPSDGNDDNEKNGSITSDGRRKSARIKNATSARRIITRSNTSSSLSDSSSLLSNALDSFYDDDDEEERGLKSQRNMPGTKGLKKSKPNSKIYGSIPGVEVNSWWHSREECSNAGVHAPWVAGISGDSQSGAWSVAISGGYEDDIDEGFRFTFTGEGGRDLKGTKQNPKNLRTGPQSKNQVLERGNLSLKRSCETGSPVRVVRGYKGDPKWAPKTGYRYDGLYQVLKWWEDTGLSGYKVYKFAFKRMDGQPPIDLEVGDPAHDVDEEGDEEEEGVANGEAEKSEVGTDRPHTIEMKSDAQE